MKSNRVTKERHKALIEDYVAQLEQADTDKVRATSGSDAVTTLSLDAVRLPPPATPGAGALGDDVYNAAGPMTEDISLHNRDILRDCAIGAPNEGAAPIDARTREGERTKIDIVKSKREPQ